jgi:hypothetical protein
MRIFRASSTSAAPSIIFGQGADRQGSHRTAPQRSVHAYAVIGQQILLYHKVNCASPSAPRHRTEMSSFPTPYARPIVTDSSKAWQPSSGGEASPQKHLPSQEPVRMPRTSYRTPRTCLGGTGTPWQSLRYSSLWCCRYAHVTTLHASSISSAESISASTESVGHPLDLHDEALELAKCMEAEVRRLRVKVRGPCAYSQDSRFPCSWKCQLTGMHVYLQAAVLTLQHRDAYHTLALKEVEVSQESTHFYEV